MTGSVILDVVIGLVFVYLLYSLFASILQEIIATKLCLRAKMLQHAIVRMLEDGKADDSHTWFGRWMKSIWSLFNRKEKLKDKFFAASFYNHPLIKYLSEDNFYSKPSYISRENYSKVVIDLLTGIGTAKGNIMVTEIDNAIRTGRFKDFLTIYPVDKGHPVEEVQKQLLKDGAPILTNNQRTQEDYELALKESSNPEAKFLEMCPETRLYLQTLWTEAEGDVVRFKALLEKWFDDTMERAIGWYKKHTQGFLLGIGFVLAIFFNVDSILIAKKLARDPKLREQMVASAGVFLEKNKDLEEQLVARQLRIDSLLDARTKATGKTDSTLVNNALKATVEDKEKLAAQEKALNARSSELIDEANALLKEDIHNVNQMLAIGWTCPSDTGDAHYKAGSKYVAHKDKKPSICMSNFHFTSIIGWLVTAIAISLGAPFWFDMLSKMMKLRASGSKIATMGPKAQAENAAVAAGQTPAQSNGGAAPVTVNINAQSGEEAVG